MNHHNNLFAQASPTDSVSVADSQKENRPDQNIFKLNFNEIKSPEFKRRPSYYEELNANVTLRKHQKKKFGLTKGGKNNENEDTAKIVERLVNTDSSDLRV